MKNYIKNYFIYWVCFSTLTIWVLFSLWLYGWWIFYLFFNLCLQRPVVITFPFVYNYMDFWFSFYRNDYEIREALDFYKVLTSFYFIYGLPSWICLLVFLYLRLEETLDMFRSNSNRILWYYWIDSLFTKFFVLFLFIFMIYAVWAIHWILWANIMNFTKNLQYFDHSLWVGKIWFITRKGAEYLIFKDFFYLTGDLIGFFIIIFYIRTVIPVVLSNFKVNSFLYKYLVEKLNRLKKKMYEKYF